MNWEYKVIELKAKSRNFWTGRANPDAIQPALNELGRQGWELVNFSTHAPYFNAILKRQR